MKKYSAAWFDHMYNTSLYSPDMDVQVNEWLAKSALARQQPDCVLDIPYGPSLRQCLDIFPVRQKNAPVFVFIHGGFWRSMSKSESSFVGPAMNAHGACVVIPSYDLCPGTTTRPITISDIALQMVSALAWTYKNIRNYGGDPSRITVSGHSAGGHLATLLMTCLWNEFDKSLPPNLARNGLALSPLTDLRPLRQTPRVRNLNISAEEALRASPALLPKPTDIQLYSFVGGNESPEFVRQNTLARKAWGSRTVPICTSLPGLNHFSIMNALTTPRHPLNDAAAKLLE